MRPHLPLARSAPSIPSRFGVPENRQPPPNLTIAPLIVE